MYYTKRLTSLITTKRAIKATVALTTDFSIPRFVKYTCPAPPNAEPILAPLCWIKIRIIEAVRQVACRINIQLLAAIFRNIKGKGFWV
jgi:hypothetical protein